MSEQHEPTPATEPPEFVVHVLLGRRALCDLPGIPKEWPHNHRWCVITLWEKESNCTDCREKAPEVLAEMEKRNGSG